MLNSLWGRFGMNTNKSKMKIITETTEWYKLLTDNSIEINSIHMSNDNKNKSFQIFYNDKEELHDGGNQKNLVLASFVTSYARLKLFRELVKINERVLYFDTDSIIYISKPNMYEPKLGDYLGEFTDELNGLSILIFLSLGAKNYAKLLSNGETDCVVKGFSLNFIASLKINFETMKNIVLKDNKKKIFVSQNKIVRNKKKWLLTTSNIEKLYGLVYDKRIIQNDLSTLPFGY
jgi:hypothetical protein